MTDWIEDLENLKKEAEQLQRLIKSIFGRAPGAYVKSTLDAEKSFRLEGYLKSYNALLIDIGVKEIESMLWQNQTVEQENQDGSYSFFINLSCTRIIFNYFDELIHNDNVLCHLDEENIELLKGMCDRAHEGDKKYYNNVIAMVSNF